MASNLDTNDFKRMVMAYVDLCEKMKEVAKFRKEKTELEKQILDYMKANDISVCRLRDGGQLVVKESKAVAPIKKEFLCDQLAAQLGSRDKAEQLTARMWQNRGVSCKATLKRLDSRSSDAEDGA